MIMKTVMKFKIEAVIKNIRFQLTFLYSSVYLLREKLLQRPKNAIRHADKMQLIGLTQTVTKNNAKHSMCDVD